MATCIARITKELAHLKRGDDLSLLVAFCDDDVSNVRCLILGPPETPYAFGFFEFEIEFPETYPIAPPSVRALTTNRGRTRFNPNIYAEGRVCLSILGTWRGRPGEEWSSAQGLESVMISIQSLMSANPYENEPGYESAARNSPEAMAYAAKIRHETLRIAVLMRLEKVLKIPSPDNEVRVVEIDAAEEPELAAFHWDPFVDALKTRFLWYYDAYLEMVEHEKGTHPAGEQFAKATFEYGNNKMLGEYQYEQLLDRLHRVRDALDAEQLAWAEDGLKQVETETQLASQLGFQFKQLQHRWHETQYDSSRMELSLPDEKNPFVWSLTMFGKPMTDLDGGIISMTFRIPPNFPDTQPRVSLDIPFYHRAVSSRGNVFYKPEKPEDLASHLISIVAALEDENPTYEPRASINPEASRLYWGGEEKRKLYLRRLRRSARDSCG